MPNTKIQLRGISRVPSDRLLKDGECAESVNVIMNETEIIPMPLPKEASEDLATGLSTSGIDVFYIHKSNTHTNYVGRLEVTVGLVTTEKLVAYVNDPNDPGANTDGWVTKVISTAVVFPIASITSIGNVLIVSDGAGTTHYALFRDDAYKYLGTEIPRPEVSFRVTSQAKASATEVATTSDPLFTEFAVFEVSSDEDEKESYRCKKYDLVVDLRELLIICDPKIILQYFLPYKRTQFIGDTKENSQIIRVIKSEHNIRHIECLKIEDRLTG